MTFPRDLKCPFSLVHFWGLGSYSGEHWRSQRLGDQKLDGDVQLRNYRSKCLTSLFSGEELGPLKDSFKETFPPDLFPRLHMSGWHWRDARGFFPCRDCIIDTQLILIGAPLMMHLLLPHWLLNTMLSLFKCLINLY